MVDSVGDQSSTQKSNMIEYAGVQSSMSNPEQNERTSKNNISYSYMNKSNLSKLTENQLIELLLNQQTPNPAPRSKWTPIPYPRKPVKQMVQNYENTIIAPPKQFADKPKPWPRNNIIPPPKQFINTPVPAPRTKKIAPIPLPRTEVNETARAFQGFTESYQVGIKNTMDPLVQLNLTRLAITHFIKQLLPQMQGLKFIETLKITFQRKVGEQIFSRIGYFNSKPKTIINANDLQPFLDVNVEQIMNTIHKWISQGSALIINSINGHYINIIQYEPLAGSSYIKLPTELQHQKHDIINPKNNDNECFRWCHVRHLNPQIKNPQRIKKTDKSFIKQLNYDGIEFPVSIKQYNKIETQNSININVFGYENEQPYPIYISKEQFDDVLNLLLFSENENTHYCLINDFNRFMFHQTNHKNKKHFCMHCLQCFSSEKVLSKHKEICLEINGKQATKMPKVGSKIGFKNFKKHL